MSESWCKGNYAHGNACGQCSRCKESLETIISESRRHKSERNALSVRALDLERRLTAALDDCETLRSAAAQLRKELDESRAAELESTKLIASMRRQTEPGYRVTECELAALKDWLNKARP